MFGKGVGMELAASNLTSEILQMFPENPLLNAASISWCFMPISDGLDTYFKLLKSVKYMLNPYPIMVSSPTFHFEKWSEGRPSRSWSMCRRPSIASWSAMVRVFPRGLCRANGGKRVKHVRAVKELLETTNSDCFILFYVFQVIIVDYTYIYIYYNYIFYIYIHSIYI